MSIGMVSRWAAGVAILAGARWILPGVVLPWVAILFVPTLLWLMDIVGMRILGRWVSMQSRNYGGWALSVLFVYLVGWILPNALVTPVAALVVGSAFWLVSGWLWPVRFS